MANRFWRACTVVAFFAALFGAPRSFGQAVDAKPAAAPAKKSPWKPEDVIFTDSANGFRVSPDGKWVVWVKGTGDKDKDTRVSNLFLSSLTEKKEIQLTCGTDNVSQPRWSPSGETIAFLSTRALPKPKPDFAPLQLWLINSRGGEAWSVTEFEKGIKSFEWIDNDTILSSAEEDASLFEGNTKERKDDTTVVDDSVHESPVRLYKFSIKDKKVARVTDNTDWIEDFDVSRDGKWAVAVASRELSYAWDQKVAPATYLVDLASGKRTEIYPDGKIRPYQVRWARDNSGFYALVPYSSDPRFFTATITKIYFYDVAAGTNTEVNLDWDRSMGSDFEVTSDGFIAFLADGVYSKPARYTRHGATWSREWIGGGQAAQWYRARLDGAKVSGGVQFTELNPHFKERTIAKTEVLHWKGANDDDVEGILYYPLKYEAGKKYPLITATHGGPAGADHDSWSESWAYSNNLLNQRGAFILKTNYHGSNSYGLKWVESICCGKYYELEIPDIEKGVDSLIAKGLVDPERVGALGWSNGSIFSIQLMIVAPELFKGRGGW